MDNQTDNQVADEGVAVAQPFSIGGALREAREQLGLSVADVANRIKFAPRQIEAMEADDFAHLPEATFVRGFVRSYARLLEIDPTPLLAALPQTHLQAAAVSESKQVEVPFPSVLTSRRSNIAWLAGGLVIALVLIVFSRMHDSAPEPAKIAAQTNVEVLELPAAASAPVAAALPSAQEVAPAVVAKPVAQDTSLMMKTPPAPGADKKEQLAKEKMIKEQVAQDLAAKKVAAKVAAKEQAAQEQMLKEQAAKERAAKKQLAKEQLAKEQAAKPPKPGNGVAELAALRLVFDEDSWVDVKDASGKIMLSKMNHAGSLVRLSGTAPISVVIGHASGVHLFYNGKEINLVPHTSVEVARLVLE